MPWEIVVLCTAAENPATTLAALQTTLDTDDAMLLLDAMEVKDSWQHAALWNSQGG